MNCDEMTHDSRGTETFCHLEPCHDYDHDNGLGLTWPRHENEVLIDPDCRDGKCSSCVGGPCEHDCHKASA